MSAICRNAASIAVAIAMAALWVWFLVLLTAPPADAQEPERCTVQTFAEPIGPVFQMPGDADTIRITYTDGTGVTLVGPFVLGDTVDAGAPFVTLEKCSGSGVPPTTPPAPTATPEPTPTPTPEPQPTPTPPSEDSCCTTIVTPGPEPTPIIPGPPTPPPGYEVPTPTTYPTPPFEPVTPTPGLPWREPHPPALPETGAGTTLLLVIGGALIAAGLILYSARR